MIIANSSQPQAGPYAAPAPGMDIQEYLCRLCGLMLQFKAQHWAAPNHATHAVLDEVCSSLDRYVDSVAELAQGTNGQFRPDILQGTQVPVHDDPLYTLSQLDGAVQEFFASLGGGAAFEAMRNSTATMLEDIKKHAYLLRLAK